MRIERTKNAGRNILFGTLLKIYQMAIPFLMRTAMIYFLGVQYLGLNSLFTSVLQVLNLAELGVGSAMVYSMYKPIVENDTYQICALLKLYRLYYRIIGTVILILGMVLLPFIPRLIRGPVPEDTNIYILYLLNLGATVLSYWLFAYKNSLLQAHQRIDVSSKISIVIDTFKYIGQFLFLWLTSNYYYYLVLALFFQVILNVVTALIVSKMFPNYKPTGSLKSTDIKAINHRIQDLFTSKIGSVVVNSADTIVISAFLGLEILAIYQNYFYILTAVIGLVTVVFNSCTAGIGNSLITETSEKNLADLRKFTFIICWISCFCSCCFLALYQPFMQIWVGKNLLMDYSIVICLVIYYYIHEVNQLLNTYKDAGGIWHKDRFRPLITAGTNLILNLLMVNHFGLYGIIFSTVLSMLFVGMPWIIYNLFTTLFEKTSMLRFLKALFEYCIVSLIACLICTFICNGINLNPFLTIIVRLLLCAIIPNALFLVIYHKKEIFKECLSLVDAMTHHKLKMISKLY